MNAFRVQHKKGRGVTLMELAVSVLIMGILLSALLGIFVISKAGAARSKHHLEAMNHARAALEAYIHNGTDTYTITTGDLAIASGSCSVVAVNYSSDLDQVTSTVSWTERRIGSGAGVTITEQLVTLVVDN